jgi:hypothetical protein
MIAGAFLVPGAASWAERWARRKKVMMNGRMGFSLGRKGSLPHNGVECVGVFSSGNDAIGDRVSVQDGVLFHGLKLVGGSLDTQHGTRVRAI